MSIRSWIIKKLSKHNWGKWSYPVNTIKARSGDYGEFRAMQFRLCKDCGICDARELNNIKSANIFENADVRENYFKMKRGEKA